MNPKVQFAYIDRDGNNCDPSSLLVPTQLASFEHAIRSLHGQVSRVAVSPLSGGHSGADVLLVRRATDTEHLLPIVVKTAEDSNLIVRERTNYENYVKNKLQYAPNLLKEDSLFLVYEYAKASFERPITLRDGYNIVSTSALCGLQRKLVRVLCAWYKQSARPISNMEQMTLESPLDNTIRNLGAEFSRYLFLAEWWDDLRKLREPVSPYSVYRCHGDLNVGNVMLDMESTDPVPLLIDFASIDEKIAYWDFAKLDRDIKTRLFLKEALRQRVSEDDIIATVKAIDLSEPVQSEESASYEAFSPERKAVEFAQSLRFEVVRQTGEHPFNAAYYDTLTYATLLTLYRKEPDQGIPQDIQKRLACESAAALLSRLLQRSLPHSANTMTKVAVTFSDKPPREIARYVGLSHGAFLQLLRERIDGTSFGDIRYLAIAGQEVFRSDEIIQALGDGNDLAKSRTIRVYLLRPGTKSFDEFIRLSNEPPDILLKKIANTREALTALANSDKHSRLRIKLYLYDAIPSMNLLETPTGFVFRPYHIGEALGKFDVISVKKESSKTAMVQMLTNYIQDLSHRAEEITLRWF